MKLATRTFLWSLLPFAVLLVGSFWAVQNRVLSKVREGLESSVKQAQVSMAASRARAAERDRQVLRVVSQNPALKAVVQQMLSDRLTHGDPDHDQDRRTVEDELQEIGKELGFDFLSVSDGNGATLAAVMSQDGRLRALSSGNEPAPQESAPQQGYFTSGGRTYQVTSVPIDEGEENLGMLSVGERFDLSAVPGQAVLMRNGKIVEINATTFGLSEVESSLQGCAENAACEIRVHGETYMSLPMESEGESRGYSIRSLQSVDAATAPIQATLRPVFIFSGLGALAAAVVMSGLSSRSIIRPIAGVITRLHESTAAGELPEFDSNGERIHEIRDLKESFNQAAAAIRDGQERLRRANVEFIESLASALDARDPYTAGHSRRVSQYACSTAEAMGLSAAELQEIRVGALLHDIGKIGIADAILQKPGRLTPEEDAVIRQHPTIGRRILEGVHGIQPYLNVVELHHENWDGTGYPRGLRAEETPLPARVVKIADAWDAMTSDRPYRQGMSRNQALATLRKVAGIQMDPAITEVFCSLWGAEQPLPEHTAVAQEAESLTRLASLTKLSEAIEPAARVEIPLQAQSKEA